MLHTLSFFKKNIQNVMQQTNSHSNTSDVKDLTVLFKMVYRELLINFPL